MNGCRPTGDCHCIAVGLANGGRRRTRRSFDRSLEFCSPVRSLELGNQRGVPGADQPAGIAVAYRRGQAAPGHSPLATVRGQLASGPNILVLSVRDARESDRASERGASALIIGRGRKRLAAVWRVACAIVRSLSWPPRRALKSRPQPPVHSSNSELPSPRFPPAFFTKNPSRFSGLVSLAYKKKDGGSHVQAGLEHHNTGVGDCVYDDGRSSDCLVRGCEPASIPKWSRMLGYLVRPPFDQNASPCS